MKTKSKKKISFNSEKNINFILLQKEKNLYIICKINQDLILRQSIILFNFASFFLNNRKYYNSNFLINKKLPKDVLRFIICFVNK